MMSTAQYIAENVAMINNHPSELNTYIIPLWEALMMLAKNANNNTNNAKNGTSGTGTGQ